jgi:hypothetical protein
MYHAKNRDPQFTFRIPDEYKNKQLTPRDGPIMSILRFTLSEKVTHWRWWYAPGSARIINDTESLPSTGRPKKKCWLNYLASTSDAAEMQSALIIQNACIIPVHDALDMVESHVISYMMYAATNVRNDQKRVMALVESGSLIINAPVFEAHNGYAPTGHKLRMDGFRMTQTIGHRTFVDWCVGRVDEVNHYVRFTDTAAFCSWRDRNVPPRNPYSGGWVIVSAVDYAPEPWTISGGQFHWIRIAASESQIEFRTSHLERYGPRSLVASVAGLEPSVGEDWDAVLQSTALYVSGHLINMMMIASVAPVSTMRHTDLRRMNIRWASGLDRAVLRGAFQESGSSSPTDLWHSYPEDALAVETTHQLLLLCGVKSPFAYLRGLYHFILGMKASFTRYSQQSTQSKNARGVALGKVNVFRRYTWIIPFAGSSDQGSDILNV